MINGELQQEIIAFIEREILEDENSGIQAFTPLLDANVLNSLGMTSLLTFIQNRYNVLIPEDYIIPEYFYSVETISGLVDELMNARTK